MTSLMPHLIREMNVEELIDIVPPERSHLWITSIIILPIVLFSGVLLCIFANTTTLSVRLS